MRQPWLDWSRRRFLATVVPLGVLNLALLVLSRTVLPAGPGRLVAGLVVAAASVALLVVVLAWSSAQDRRSPPSP